MFGRPKRGTEEAKACPACGHAGLRELRMTDFDFGDSQIGHFESECDECGWNSSYPDGIPCPACGADLRHAGGITVVGTLHGKEVGRASKRLLGDGSRYAVTGLPGRVDRTTDTCAACGTELGHHDWSF